jgi:ABC-type bacteriocin/lantibiotic exporter with double-glycine peptidase domain
MKVVLQDEISGCGLAVVATVAGKNYIEVKQYANSIGIYAEDKRLYSDTAYVRKLLTHYGVKSSNLENPFESWDKLSNTALLSIKYHIKNGEPYWHWTVFHRSGRTAVVLDPARYLVTNERSDFYDIQPKWFIEIYGT